MKDLIRQKIIDALASPIPSFTRRDVHVPTIKGKAVAVLGMRRTGKSTFLWQIVTDRMAKGMAREGTLYFNFEDERLAGMQSSNLQSIVEEYYSLHPEWRKDHRALFMFDEIQTVPGWEVFVRRLLDTETADIFISGSSARLLSREVATSIRGRAMEALVHPFSFREFLRHLGKEPETEGERFSKATRSEVQKGLFEYLDRGGFPESIGASTRDHANLLRGYVDTALLRDVVERHEVSHPVALRWLVRQLLSNAAGTFSVNKFYGDLRSQGMPIAKDTLHAYLGHLEDSFLIRVVSLLTDSERRRMVNPRRVYPIDPGLIPLFERTGRRNLGHALETSVMLELERQGAEIAYVRNADGSEVDFSARFPDSREELIQVCADLGSSEVREREVGALLAAQKESTRATLHLVSMDLEQPRGLPGSIQWMRAADWLLHHGSIEAGSGA